MKKVKKILMAWLTCLTIGVSTVGMTSCDEVMDMLKDGLNVFITTNKDGISGDEGTPNNQPPVKTPSKGLNIVSDGDGQCRYDPQTGETTCTPITYAVKGMGTCTDTDVVIPAEYNDGIVGCVGFAGEGTEEIVRRYAADLAREEGQEISEEQIETAISNLLLQFGALTEVKIKRIWVSSTVTEFNVIGIDSLTEIVLEKGVEKFTAAGCYNFKTLYYTGTTEDWKAVNLAWMFPVEYFTATVYFYSESAPTTSGYYWHYVDGEPTAW